MNVQSVFAAIKRLMKGGTTSLVCKLKLLRRYPEYINVVGQVEVRNAGKVVDTIPFEDALLVTPQDDITTLLDSVLSQVDADVAVALAPKVNFICAPTKEHPYVISVMSTQLAPIIGSYMLYGRITETELTEAFRRVHDVLITITPPGNNSTADVVTTIPVQENLSSNPPATTSTTPQGYVPNTVDLQSTTGSEGTDSLTRMLSELDSVPEALATDDITPLRAEANQHKQEKLAEVANANMDKAWEALMAGKADAPGTITTDDNDVEVQKYLNEADPGGHIKVVSKDTKLPPADPNTKHFISGTIIE